ncbi:aldo/keto reductase [Edaphobacter aggregans]|uniref:aldo/keto reductase n=1 Tax=Edaphobacter aggregans TaxID=570835 RepID=UPI0009FED098|nr:aldo/keto reductase [Edaphobacter aggregans]
MGRDKMRGLGRRGFLKGGAGAVAVGVAGVAMPVRANGAEAAEALDAAAAAKAVQAMMPTRNLGKTGFKAGIFGLGGQGALETKNNAAVAVPVIERALELGVNYFDTSAIYGGPERWSEQYLGTALKGHRNDVFIATKTKERTRDAAMRNIEVSLKLLGTDHVDSWQLHDVGIQEDVDQIFAKGGAMEALLAAKEQGMVKHLGVTGRFRPEALMECIRRFDFDTVLMGLNAADKYHYSFAKELLPMAVGKQMGVIGMKVMARGRILSSWTPPPVEQQKKSWEGTGAIATRPGTLTKRETTFYTLSLPLSTAIIGCDSVAQVEECVKLAQEFTPLSEAQMTELAEKTAPIAEQALFFRMMPR